MDEKQQNEIFSSLPNEQTISRVTPRTVSSARLHKHLVCRIDIALKPRSNFAISARRRGRGGGRGGGPRATVKHSLTINGAVWGYPRVTAS